MTFELWQRKSQEDMLRKMNSEQLIWNTKKEQKLANEEVSMELDTKTTVNETQMGNIIDKMFKATLAKKIKTDKKKPFGRSQKQPEVNGHKKMVPSKKATYPVRSRIQTRTQDHNSSNNNS